MAKRHVVPNNCDLTEKERVVCECHLPAAGAIAYLGAAGDHESSAHILSDTRRDRIAPSAVGSRWRPGWRQNGPWQRYRHADGQSSARYSSATQLYTTTIRLRGALWRISGSQSASFDYRVWFRRPFDISECALFVQEGLTAYWTRGIVQGSVSARTGRLLLLSHKRDCCPRAMPIATIR